MRRLMLVLALIGASVLFLGAAPGSASASNCTNPSIMTPTVWQADGNYLRFYAGVQGCTDVDSVDLYRYLANVTTDIPSHHAGASWIDYSQCTIGCEHVAPFVPNPDAYNCSGVVSTCATTWYIHPWCAGATHVIRTQFAFRLHSASQHSWGPYHYVQSTNYAIVC